jgi:hypothetical protein
VDWLQSAIPSPGTSTPRLGHLTHYRRSTYHRRPQTPGPSFCASQAALSVCQFPGFLSSIPVSDGPFDWIPWASLQMVSTSHDPRVRWERNRWEPEPRTSSKANQAQGIGLHHHFFLFDMFPSSGYMSMFAYPKATKQSMLGV